ncbi:hypothetical protein TGMAS_216850 [Toxoplasma gondii MAS]|uniref:Uncharacterized protein n=1 Tax=Toxoplasma gondii MAS TaxID=943118 RepID=A0A086QEA4_TOXGO|nr:hypothetical protein TGMAS_216850 [Toxoplasma gondii MAS]
MQNEGEQAKPILGRQRIVIESDEERQRSPDISRLHNAGGAGKGESNEEDEVMFVRAVDLEVFEVSSESVNPASPQKKKGRQHRQSSASNAVVDSTSQGGQTQTTPPCLLSPCVGSSREALPDFSEGLALLFCSSVNQIEMVFGEHQGDIFCFYRGRPLCTIWVQGFIVSVEERAGLFSVDDGTKVLEGTFDAFPASGDKSESPVHLTEQALPQQNEPEIVIVDDDSEQNDDVSVVCQGRTSFSAGDDVSVVSARNREAKEGGEEVDSATDGNWREENGRFVSLQRTRKFSLRGTTEQLKTAQLEGAYVSLLLQLVPVMVDADVILSFHLLRVSDCPNRCANAEAEWITHVLRWQLGISQRA